MKILLINHYAGSPELGMEFRPYYLAREWKKMGHETLIIGGTYSHLRKSQPPAGFQTIDNIPYFWLKTLKYKGNGIKRFLSMIQFTLELICRKKKVLINFKPDIVIASSTYTIDNFAAKQIAKKYHAKYIYEIHDLWPLSPMELGGMSKWHPFILLLQWAENFAYKNCDAVVSMLPNAKEHCVEHRLDAEKFYYVPNGSVEEDWKNPRELPETYSNLFLQLKSNGKFLVGYTGAHGVANSLKDIINAVSELKNEHIALVLVGDGQEKENLMTYSSQLDCDNVFFLNPIEKLAIPNLLKEFDVLYIGLQRQSLFRFGTSPNKMFDYMMAGKPIIQAIEAGNNLVEEAQCGVSAEPENIQDIKNAILKIKNMSSEERKLLGENGRKFVLKEHTYSVLAERFLNIMQKIGKKI
jgi:glycosyltransferase involved in cell wall biosynthesis